MNNTFKNEILKIKEKKENASLSKEDSIAKIKDAYNAYVDSIINSIKQGMRKAVEEGKLINKAKVQGSYQCSRIDEMDASRDAKHQVGPNENLCVSVANFNEAILNKIKTRDGFNVEGITFTCNDSTLALCPLFTVDNPIIGKYGTKLVHMTPNGILLSKDVTNRAKEEGINIKTSFIYSASSPDSNSDYFSSYTRRSEFEGNIAKTLTQVSYHYGTIIFDGVMNLE